MMQIGICSPFMPHDLADLLDTGSQAKLREVRGVLATFVTPLVRGLHRRGHSLSVFCLDRSVAAPLRLKGERLAIHVIPKRRSRHCLLDIYRVESQLISEAIAQEAPVAINAQWCYEHAWAALKSKVPTVVTCQDMPLQYTGMGISWYMWYHLALAWGVIRKARHLISVSPICAQLIQRHFSCGGPMVVVPNGLASEVFERGRRRLQKPAAGGRPFTFCSVGGWGKLKNIATLIRAFALVRAQVPMARLHLFGYDLGPGQPGEQWAQKRGLHPGIVFCGSVAHEHLLDFLETEADMMVHPSLIESQCMALAEAMACGIPVLGGRTSGAVPWTLEDGHCGTLCDIKDAAILAGEMVRSARQPDENRATVIRAWESVHQRFHMEPIVSAYETILGELAAIQDGTTSFRRRSAE
jgi:glycosyltransferase involved in cell wall biosynthesis